MQQKRDIQILESAEYHSRMRELCHLPSCANESREITESKQYLNLQLLSYL